MSTKVNLVPDENGNDPFVQISGTNIMQPVDIQSHLQTTIQTHNAVSVTNGTGSYSTTWTDCNGYDQVGVTMLADAGVAGTGVYAAWSNDGVTQHGYENVIPTSGLASTSKSGGVPVRARYLKLQAFNNDATTHTMSTWAYLKA